MDKTVCLLIAQQDFSSKSTEELKLLSKTADSDLTGRLIAIQTLGKLFGSAVQQSDFGAFSDVGDLELFGILLSDLGEEAQTLKELKDKTDYYLQNGGAK
ncbi:hypothetical protein J3998_12045 [Thiomicrorhabdus sp. 6S2-11]|uniref:HEAT repeat domain-containing protein n=1 Tax=Thiomicrorhabdus marina TaxID=2818442 RepID=A0ABS3Q7I3_9GAMM|nr:hypothetical protein [Thiomicrorhabdus marina]MBO1928305.1 hypothetical protein [Thiomicrorhabdus marina]